MKCPCEIENVKTLKKGMKIVLAIEKDNVKEIMKHLHNFIDRPIIADLLIDAEEAKKRMEAISEEQRKKIYALFRNIAEYIGDSVDSIKIEMKRQFCQESQYEDFSLSTCSHKLAGDFIEWLIEFCFENGIRISEHPREGFRDIEKYLALCLRKRICCICGKPADVHHWDSIGAGRDRKKVDNSQHRKIALCRVHHTEAHTIGRESFEKKYHVYGILLEK